VKKMLRRKSNHAQLVEELARWGRFVWAAQGDDQVPFTVRVDYWEEFAPEPETVSVPAEGTFLVRNGKVLALDKEEDSG
jgi:hypothetical protein